MRRTSVFVAIAFLAGLGIGFFARRTGRETLLSRDTHAADLAAIDKFHQEDIRVTLLQDPKGLVDIWTEDAVRFIPGSPPDVGKHAIQAQNEKGRAEYPGFKVLSYVPKYKNIQIEGGLACEWGEHNAQYKLSPEAPPVSLNLKGFDVLKRQSDGSWKFAVLIADQ
jgi:ketosteroid isomerase-like protein